MTQIPEQATPEADGLPHAIATSEVVGLGAANVAIFGINYAPEVTGIAPYTTALAEYLVGIARSVTAITGFPCYPSWELPIEYRRRFRASQDRHGVHVSQLRHVVPKRQDTVRRAMYELTFFAHSASLRLHLKPDIVLGVTPALAGAGAAVMLARRLNVPSLVVVQDLMGLAAIQSGIKGGTRIARAVGAVERKVLAAADQVVVVSEGFRRRLVAYGLDGSRIHTVRNWTHLPEERADRESTRRLLGWEAGQIVVLHTGNMGLKQDLGNVVEAARLSVHCKDLTWVLMGDGSQRAALERQAANLPNLKFLPLCEREMYRSVLQAADLLLVNERPTVEDMSLPSKLTSYFASGRPTIGAVNNHGVTAAELQVAGDQYQVAPGNPEALVAAVQSLAGDPEWRDAAGARARDYADRTLSAASSLGQYEKIIGNALAERGR